MMSKPKIICCYVVAGICLLGGGQYRAHAANVAPTLSASAIVPDEAASASAMVEAQASETTGAASHIGNMPRSAVKAAADAERDFDPSKFGRITTETLPLENGERLVMRVNGQPVTYDDFMIQVRLAGASLLAKHPDGEQGIAAALAPAVEDPLILTALYRKFATGNSLAIQPREVDARIKSALGDRNPSVRNALQHLNGDEMHRFVTDNLIREKVEKLLGDRATSVPATQEEISSFTITMKPTTAPVQLTRARHIVIRATPDMSQFNLNDAEAKTSDVLEKIHAGLDFKIAARQYSQDRFTAYLGGDVGYFKPGQMYEAFEKAADKLKPGQISGVIRTPVGFHIIQVTERHDDDLLLQLDKYRRTMAVEQWKQKSGEAAKVERFFGE